MERGVLRQDLAPRALLRLSFPRTAPAAAQQSKRGDTSPGAQLEG